MLKYLSSAVLLICSLAGASKAQSGLLFGDLTVGVPYSFNFGQGLSAIPLSGGGSIDGITYSYQITFSFTLVGGSTLPPGLTLSPSGLISGTPTQSGNFTFTIDLNYTFSETVNGMTYSGSASVPYPALTLDVSGNSGPPLAVVPAALTFSLNQGEATAATQSVVISNSGSTAESFTASATTGSGGDWLSVSPGSGSVAAFATSSLSISVDPSKLSTGTYLGTVSISAGTQQFEIPVTATVSGGQAQLQISQSGLFFETVANGGQPPSQSVTVLNGGSGSLNFSVSTSTTSGGANWLSASPSSGAVTSSQSASVAVKINTAGLGAGDYYGQVQFSSSGATNSPQTVAVVLHIASAATHLGASVDPTGLVFIGSAGGADPTAQTISVTNPATSTLTFAAAPFFNQGTNWFTVKPTSGTVNASNSPVQITVQPTISGLAAGVYVGEIVLHFTEDNSNKHIAVLLVVIPGGAVSQTAHIRAHTTAGCVPKKLYPVFTQLGASFTAVAAWPTPITVTIVDDCGNFMTSGSVTASFSDGDPSLPLTSLNNGTWSATWQPQSSSAQVVITVDALQMAPPLEGTQNIGGSLQANPTTPSVGAVVSAAVFANNQPLAPGAFASIYGVHLSGGQNLAPSLPLGTQLGGTQVVLGGRPLPLQYAGDGQVNAIIPYDVPPNSTQQLIVTNGPALSVPQSVVVASAQPAVFAYDKDFGSIKVYRNGSAPFQVDATHPATAGDIIVIACAGLGPVNPPVAAGSAAPSNPPAITINPVKVTIGGKDANVVFHGLAPGFAGEYQVNAQIPKGIAPGTAVPLTVSVAGFDSAPVNIAIK